MCSPKQTLVASAYLSSYACKWAQTPTSLLVNPAHNDVQGLNQILNCDTLKFQKEAITQLQ